jgi:hypothetical protein
VPNVLKITVDNPEEILNSGAYGAGALIRVQAAATEAGAFADVSGTGATATLTVVAGTTVYTAYDPSGTATTWYKTRYENVAATRLSDWTPAFQAGGEEGGYLCSLYDVKQRLGITPSNTASDEGLLELIRAVTVEIERLTGRDFTGDRSDQVYTFDVPEPDSVLYIDRGIQSITTLELATTTGGAYTATTAYFLRPKDRDWVGEPYTRIELYQSWFNEGYDTVKVTGRLGWASVPGEVSRIAQTAVVSQWMTKGSEGPRAVIGESGRAIILRDVSPADWDTLMRLSAVKVA